MEERGIKLGGIGSLTVPVPLAVGTLQWGTTWLDEAFVNPKGRIQDSTAAQVSECMRDAGVTLWDTAEGYGGGTSESRVGRVVKQPPGLVMTKFLPAPWRMTHASFESALRSSLARLKIAKCPVYLLHSPVHWRPIEFWVEAAARCKRKGLLEAFGLSNCNAEQVRRAVTAGEKYGVKIAVNQIMYNMLDYNSDRLRETEAVCKELGVTIVGYSPLGQGLLCDGLTEATFRTNRPAKMTGIKWEQLDALRRKIKEIASQRDKTMAQVVLNWSLCKGVLPLVGCRSSKQAKDSLGCLGWRLDESEVSALDQLALHRSTLDGPAWRRAIFVSLASLLMIACRFLAAIGLYKDQ